MLFQAQVQVGLTAELNATFKFQILASNASFIRFFSVHIPCELGSSNHIVLGIQLGPSLCSCALQAEHIGQY